MRMLKLVLCYLRTILNCRSSTGMKIKLPSSIEENNLNFGIMTNHIMMLDDHNAKVQFFLSNVMLLSASVVFFRFCEAGGLMIIHKRTNNMVTHGVIPNVRLMLIIFKLAISSHLKY